MKVGDYVRTKNKGIFKLDDSLYYNEDFKEYWFKAPNDYGNYRTTERAVVKSSPNIIDLIEAGDIVVIINGLNEEELILIKDLKREKPILESHKIKSILTKEQFESMEYKRGE